MQFLTVILDFKKGLFESRSFKFTLKGSLVFYQQNHDYTNEVWTHDPLKYINKINIGLDYQIIEKHQFPEPRIQFLEIDQPW